MLLDPSVTLTIPHLDTEREEFIRDRSNYISFGAIRVYETRNKGQEVLRWMQAASDHDECYPSPLIASMVQKGWLQTKFVQNVSFPGYASLQVFVMPEDIGRRFRHGSISEFRRSLKSIMRFIDTDTATWAARYDHVTSIKTYHEAHTNNESLFYMFNTLNSPSPSIDQTRDYYAQHAVDDILNDCVQGLQSVLYPYQKRSAATMVQRETNPKRSLDPRKPLHRSPTDEEFYFDKEDGVLLRHPYLYEEPRGGILAETMGYGKTLICLAVILATRGHFPSVPDGRLDLVPEARPRVASLMQMTAAKAGRAAIPWKAEFHALKKLGDHHERCTEELKKHVRDYDEPIFTPSTPSRKGKRQATKTVKLCSATLVIVPPNLLVQWQHEISKHVEAGALDVLVIDHSTKRIPECRDLIKYDVILITKARFEQEYRDNDLHTGKRGRGEEVFQSPLTDMRWLRVICDEGHGFVGTASRTNAIAMLDKMYVERRWVVSGTPSNTLLGVEVGLAANEVTADVHHPNNDARLALQARRAPDSLGQESRDLEELRFIVMKFLKVQPWANTQGIDQANWKRYISSLDRDERHRKAICLRTLLQSLIVRHRIEDIEADLSLPPLYNKVAYLEPCYYDKLSINLFISVLAFNAVTSERTDEDYMFHAKNRKQLDLLIANLRHSSFHWVGFKHSDIQESVRISKLYLDKNPDVSRDDRALLTTAIAVGEQAISDPGWRAFSTLHEVGVFVDSFPEYAAESWALDGQKSSPLLVGTVQARAAQQHVEEHISEHDPGEGLVGAGLRAMQAARRRAADEDQASAKVKAAVSSLEEAKLKNQSAGTRGSPNLPLSPSSKRRRSTNSQLRPSSSLAKTHIVGFSSAKLTYLVDRVMEWQAEEKIIIFYDSNNVAFWIAEALELLSVKFLIYSNTLTVGRRATYLATFNQKEEFRVLLMDVKQAAHGLHVACASRVFITSPIWQPSIESQAIKRAHRIGQSKPVYVETLVLKDTLEDRMLRRRKQMSNLELQRAEKSLLDDGTMNQIIKDEKFIPFGHAQDSSRIAELATPTALFGRQGSFQHVDHPDQGLVLAAGDVPVSSRAKGSPREHKLPLFPGAGETAEGARGSKKTKTQRRP